MERKVFISHRSTDKAVADLLVDFFAGTGIPKEAVFCSSLPGNDVGERISEDVRNAMKQSAVNIAILSRDYYKSAYCLNEAGVFWFQNDVPVIAIALPEISEKNMYGFLNDNYKLRRLDCSTDISHIYDAVQEALEATLVKTSIVLREVQKLMDRYKGFLDARADVSPEHEAQPATPSAPAAESADDPMTDDEKVLLYYILEKKARKVSKADFIQWMNEKEIHGISADNAFDFSALRYRCVVEHDMLELDVREFKAYSVNAKTLLPELKACADERVSLASGVFESLWNLGKFDVHAKWFVFYIIDEKVTDFRAHWKEMEQIVRIRQWELTRFGSTLSDHYSECLDLFVKHGLVYASQWTEQGNPCQYTLYPSIQPWLSGHLDFIQRGLDSRQQYQFCDVMRGDGISW